MSTLKSYIKSLIPPLFIRKLKAYFGSWHGDFESWSKAVSMSGSYEAPQILEQVKNSLLKVKAGEAAFERDSVLFYDDDYNYPLLTSLLLIAAAEENDLEVLDFGGSLGSTYFQNKKLLSVIPSIKWAVVEQDNFVQCGHEYFSEGGIKFYNSIDECLLHQTNQTILLSSVIQYIPEPDQLLATLIEREFKYIIIDRTPFFKDKPDRITVQKVPDVIYRASYPCWIFNEGKFINRFREKYELILGFDSLDVCNLPAEFKGFLFKKK